MICELLLKCVALITVIHGLRAVCRRIGPRASGLILGLPSSTGIILFLCSRERGSTGMSEMAEASLLGLVAAVSLPLAYAHAAQRGWCLPRAIGAAIAAYFIVAWGLGSLHPGGPFECLGLALGAILLTSILAARIDLPRGSVTGFTRSPRWSSVVRTAVPAVYVLVVGIASGAASPKWAGLVSTFPSMSTVLLTVTHLEEGPVEASRIARALPSANLSTAAFLAAYRFGCPLLGPGWAMILGYAVALTNLAAIELARARRDLVRIFRTETRQTNKRQAIGPRRPIRAMFRTHVRSAPKYLGRHSPARRKRFAPRLEAVPC
jgi:plasmid stabilization system protein ParE